MSVETVHARGCWPADCARQERDFDAEVRKSWNLGEIRKLPRNSSALHGEISGSELEDLEIELDTQELWGVKVGVFD